MLGWKRSPYSDALARFWMVYRRQSFHVAQGGSEFKLLQQAVRADAAYRAPPHSRHATNTESANESVAAMVLKASRIFYDVEAWRRALVGLDVVIGPRIHGSMLALAAGTPTITFAFDARISELCESMRLACAQPHELEPEPPGGGVGNLEAFITRVASGFDGAAFDARRAEVAARYVELFRTAGVELNPRVAALATNRSA